MECFETFLIGSFTTFTTNSLFEEIIDRPFLITEWIVPAELSKCIAYSSKKLCKIYKNRPISCKNFPLIAQNKVHEFCSFKERFLDGVFYEPTFLKQISLIDFYLFKIFHEKGEDGLKERLFEDKPFNSPLLYNNYLVLILLLSKVDIIGALNKQNVLLNSLKECSIEEITVIIPGTDYCLTGSLEGLKANLEYLIYKIEKENLIEHLKMTILSALDK